MTVASSVVMEGRLRKFLLPFMIYKPVGSYKVKSIRELDIPPFRAGERLEIPV